MEPSLISGRKCLCCNGLFLPSPKTRSTQRFCSKAPCRKASKARSDAQWRRKNPGYHRGPEQVERVRQWRARNPSYSCGRKRGKSPLALQDLVPTQVVDEQPLVRDVVAPTSDFSPGAPPSISCNAATTSCNGVALQDFIQALNPLVVGLIATIMGDALQESFVLFAQKLVERGRRTQDQFRANPRSDAAPQTSNSN